MLKKMPPATSRLKQIQISARDSSQQQEIDVFLEIGLSILYREAEDAPSLEAFNAWLDRAWRTLVYGRHSCPWQGELDLGDL